MRLTETVTDPFDTATFAPVGLDGTDTAGAVAGGVVSGVASIVSSATTRIVGEEKVNPLASIRNVLLSEVIEVVEVFATPVESSITDTSNCFVEAIFDPHRQRAVSSGMRAWYAPVVTVVPSVSKCGFTVFRSRAPVVLSNDGGVAPFVLSPITRVGVSEHDV